MSDRDSMHPDEERAAKHVRALPDVEANAAFRDRLRSAFVTGEINHAAAPTAQPAPHRRHRWVLWMVPALIAAAAVVLVVTRPAAFRVIAVNGSGNIRVNEELLALSSRDDLVRVVHSGATLALPDSGAIDLLSENIVLMEMTPGTRATVPQPPGRWFHRAAACSLMAGEIRIKTGPRFHGSKLRVYTPEGMAEITGTMLSVQCDGGGTCVCVVEGTAHVGVNEADLQAVPPGSRKVMLRDGTRKIIPIQEAHRDGVIDFNRRLGDRIGPRQ
jgi:ferric-dicitrate binding protein FerR (iron transport regulator)